MDYDDYGFDESAQGVARLLGEIAQQRITIAELQHQGHYSDAGQVADDLLSQSDWLPAGGAPSSTRRRLPQSVRTSRCSSTAASRAAGRPTTQARSAHSAALVDQPPGWADRRKAWTANIGGTLTGLHSARA